MDLTSTSPPEQSPPNPTPPPSRPTSSSDQTHSASPKPTFPRVKFASEIPSRSVKISSPPSPPPPPPPPTYNPRVSFDTFAYHSATNPAYSTVFQHRFYADQGRNARTFLCGTDESDYSAYALEYIIENLVDDGDTIVCVRVVDRESDMMKEFMSNQAEYRLAAQKVRKRVEKMLDANKGPAVKVIIELIVGKIGETMNKMVHLHHPMGVVVGTRGKNLTESNFGKSSVSDHLYKHSPVPVIIVRPKKKRRKNQKKREDRPDRRKYKPLQLGHGNEGETGKFRDVLEASHSESEAVARAIGLQDSVERLEAFLDHNRSRAASREPRPMSQDTSGESTEEEEEEDDDDGEGAPLSRTSSAGSNLNPGWVEHPPVHIDVIAPSDEDDVEPGEYRVDMPNYESEEEEEESEVEPDGDSLEEKSKEKE